MREATSGPRQLDKLRKSLDAWQERKKDSGDRGTGDRGTGHLFYYY
jgi:hypothetical protein